MRGEGRVKFGCEGAGDSEGLLEFRGEEGEGLRRGSIRWVRG